MVDGLRDRQNSFLRDMYGRERNNSQEKLELNCNIVADWSDNLIIGYLCASRLCVRNNCVREKLDMCLVERRQIF